MRTCKDCPFWDQQSAASKYGFCRVNPPTTGARPGDGPTISPMGGWPRTGPLEWCSVIRPETKITPKEGN